MLETDVLIPTEYPHIVLTPQDVPIIEETTMKVVESQTFYLLAKLSFLSALAFVT